MMTTTTEKLKSLGITERKLEKAKTACENAGVFFSKNELKVLLLLCKELTTGEIAEVVDLSPRTIEPIRANLKKITTSKTLLGIGLWAGKHSLVEIIEKEEEFVNL
jgi:DNA-binding NarL/FixJ family response regulator